MSNGKYKVQSIKGKVQRGKYKGESIMFKKALQPSPSTNNNHEV